MEIIVVLIGGFLLGIPLIAIIALVRSASTRKLLEETSWEYRDKISDLKGEIANLRRELAEVSQRATPADAVPAAAPAAEVREAIKVPRPITARVQAPELMPIPFATPVEKTVQPHVDLQAGVAPPPQIAFKQAAAMPPASEAVPAAKLETQAPTESIKPTQPESAAPPQPHREDPPIHATDWKTAAPSFYPIDDKPPRKSFAEWLRSILPLEEVLGMNLFAKIGIVLLVLGFALLGQLAFTSMGPGARVAILYAVAAAMLGGGIRLESRERYRILGHVGIGGGWALLFFTTYAMNQVAAMKILSSITLNCVFMLVVAGAMVAHTLRYRSQVVTGLAFLLAFSTVAISQDTVYSLVAGVILALAVVGITLRMGWYELEVFGIVASYANHFYWLYKLYPDGMAGHRFPEFWPSAIILLLYWAVFRVSYVARGIRVPRDETVSTIAALLNVTLLGVVMKFQSTRPELAFYGMLALGAAEFFFGQLPATRRRRPAFILLTVIGTLLIFAAVPFKFSGDNIALFWMIAAEVLLIAGIVQLEVVFRRLGLLAGVVTGLLVLYEAQGIVDLRTHSESRLLQDGVLLLTCSALFYFNSLFIGSKWRRLFASIDGPLVVAQSYIGCMTAFLGVWAIFSGESTAIGWAVLMLASAFGVHHLNNKHLIAQTTALMAAVAVRAGVFNCHLDASYPHRIAGRLLTLPILAALCYATAWALSGVRDFRIAVRTLLLWMASALLVTLAWLELPPMAIAPAWMALVVALALIGRRFKLSEFAFQGHALAALVVAQLLAVNLYAHNSIDRYLPFMGCAAALYAISRYCTLAGASYRRPAAWLHTWGATALLAALAWNVAAQPWLAAVWAVFALGLAVVDRVFDIEELPNQAHVLALLAVLRAVTLNLYTLEKWHSVDLRLITVSILVAVLYAMARLVRIPETLRYAGIRHAYTWTGSGLAAWMLWSELQPIAVAPGLAIFGLLLFEFGSWQKQRQLRLQAYVALAAAFGRIFFVNLTAATLPGELMSPRIYTVAPIALILFYVWSRLQSKKAEPEIGSWSAADLIAYFGTGCVAALLWFQTSAEWIVVAWAVLALALMTTTLLLEKEVFQQQTALLVAGIVARGLAHNIFGGSYFVDGEWRGGFLVLSLAAALLFAALPIAFHLRKRYDDAPPQSFLSRILAVKYPEQLFFFAPVAIVTFMIAVKMNSGMITFSLGIEGLILVLLGLLVSQRSYRFTGLLLLLVCVGKIVVRDAWQLGQRDRYITFIVLGAALTLVSALYSKYRETVRRLL